MRQKRYEKFSKIAYDRLKQVPGVIVNQPEGAFYMGVVFEDGVLNHQQYLPIKSREIRDLVENLVNVAGVSPDKRFVYYLLASTGICVVPMTSFSTELNGFRMTLLEPDESKFKENIEILAKAIEEYTSTSKEVDVSRVDTLFGNQSIQWAKNYN
jgi:alanine-synthesizing transaminase